MKKFSVRFVSLTLALVLIAGAAWAFINTASYKKNVKMTVTVETPEGEVSGSAVREISNAAPMVKLNWPHGGNPASVRGEAVVIDLGERGVLFALINGNGEAGRFYQAFPPPGGHPQDEAAFHYFSDLSVGTSAPLDQDYWPMFVTFTDMNDPKSVVLAWGGKFNVETQKHDHVNNMKNLYGDGIQLKNITLEITDEPVTWKVDNVLPWLSSLKGGYLDGKFAGGGPELSNILYGGNFKIGEQK